jgi:hypothetical protein
MLHPSVVLRDSSILVIFPLESTGLLLSLLALSVVNAGRYGPLWLGEDINIPLHGVDSLTADLVAANFLVNVGLEH